MATPRIDYEAELTKKICKDNLLDADPFVLLDIGASQGIDNVWKNFGNNIKAYGFDPLVNEVRRLNTNEKNKNIRYFDAFITDKNRNLNPYKNSEVWSRASFNEANKITNTNFIKIFNNNNDDIVYSENYYSIDNFVKKNNLDNIDFIKIDTDGHDINVLDGCHFALKNLEIIGLFIECQLQGENKKKSNIFRNIDKFLADRGYSLYDFELYRYSRKCLPSKFKHRLFAQTEKGQIFWGDAFFSKDIISSNFKKKIKQICIFEIFGIYDCAAEIIIDMYKQNELNTHQYEKWLNILARKNSMKFNTYNELISAFNQNPYSFFPNKYGSDYRIYEILKSIKIFFKRHLNDEK